MYATAKESPTNAWKKQQLNPAKETHVVLLSSLLIYKNKKINIYYWS